MHTAVSTMIPSYWDGQLLTLAQGIQQKAYSNIMAFIDMWYKEMSCIYPLSSFPLYSPPYYFSLLLSAHFFFLVLPLPFYLFLLLIFFLSLCLSVT